MDKYIEIEDSCEIMSDHYGDFLKRKRELTPWIVKEWTTGEGIMEIHHYMVRIKKKTQGT